VDQPHFERPAVSRQRALDQNFFAHEPSGSAIIKKQSAYSHLIFRTRRHPCRQKNKLRIHT
jgi:hypothetical protein